MRTLLGLGADPLRRNGAGESAVDCARRLGLAHLVSAMETHVRSKGYWRNMTYFLCCSLFERKGF